MKLKRLNAKCLYPDCPEPGRTRGLCNKHYVGALRLVRKNQTTWAKLEKAGKAKPRKKWAAEKWFLEE